MSLFIQSIAFKFSFLVLQFHAHNWWCRWCGIKATCSCAHPSPPRENFLSIRWFLAKHNFYRLFVSLDESELVFTAKKSDQSDGGCRWLGFEPTLREGDLLVFGFVFVVFWLQANSTGGRILLYLDPTSILPTVPALVIVINPEWFEISRYVLHFNHIWSWDNIRKKLLHLWV